MTQSTTVRKPLPRESRPARRRHTDLVADAYGQLRMRIIEGRLAPGSPFIETDVAALLEVSRTPVRSALQRLQQEGFVRFSRIGGTIRVFVTSLTIEDMRELYLIVGVLEGLAARLAAGLPNTIREGLATTMRDLNDRLRAASHAHPPAIDEAKELHVRFHRSCQEAAAGRRLRAELDAIQPQAERYERVYTTALIEQIDLSLQEHEAIILAIASGDPDAAEQATGANWRNSIERYARVIAMHGELGVW